MRTARTLKSHVKRPLSNILQAVVLNHINRGVKDMDDAGGARIE